MGSDCRTAVRPRHRDYAVSVLNGHDDAHRNRRRHPEHVQVLRFSVRAALVALPEDSLTTWSSTWSFINPPPHESGLPSRGAVPRRRLLGSGG